MAPIHSSYIVLFDPVRAPLPTILTTTQEYNKGFKHIKQGLSVTPYPDPATIYCQLAISDPGDDMFEDIYLDDLYVLVAELPSNSLANNNRVQVNKRISCHWLLVNHVISGNLGGLLECGVQVKMDGEEVWDDTIEVAISYAGSVGASLWSEINKDRAQVGLAHFFFVEIG